MDTILIIYKLIEKTSHSFSFMSQMLHLLILSLTINLKEYSILFV